MNKEFKEAVADRIFGCDQSMLAEIFNIFASDYDNLEFFLHKEEVYIFNILNNKQASRAVAKFGFEAIAKASNKDWIIYAEKDENEEWVFSSKSPEAAVHEFLEQIIHDLIARPKEYPSWCWEYIAQPLACLIENHHN